MHTYTHCSPDGPYEIFTQFRCRILSLSLYFPLSHQTRNKNRMWIGTIEQWVFVNYHFLRFDEKHHIDTVRMVWWLHKTLYRFMGFFSCCSRLSNNNSNDLNEHRCECDRLSSAPIFFFGVLTPNNRDSKIFFGKFHAILFI